MPYQKSSISDHDQIEDVENSFEAIKEYYYSILLIFYYRIKPWWIQIKLNRGAKELFKMQLKCKNHAEIRNSKINEHG